MVSQHTYDVVKSHLDDMGKLEHLDFGTNRIVAAALQYFHGLSEVWDGQIRRDWVRCSFRQRETVTTLVVVTRTENTQDVVFLTERTPTACVLRFLCKMAEETLNWVPDKYARI